MSSEPIISVMGLDVDFGCVGEGEISTVELALLLENRGEGAHSYKDVKGICV